LDTSGPAGQTAELISSSGPVTTVPNLQLPLANDFLDDTNNDVRIFGPTITTTKP
jgi:hypothetical protein